MEPKFKIGDRVRITNIEGIVDSNYITGASIIHLVRIKDKGLVEYNEKVLELIESNITDTHPELLADMNKLGQSIEDAADEHASNMYGNSCGAKYEIKASIEDFKAGALSQAAREHWFNEFNNKTNKL